MVSTAEMGVQDNIVKKPEANLNKALEKNKKTPTIVQPFRDCSIQYICCELPANQAEYNHYPTTQEVSKPR